MFINNTEPPLKSKAPVTIAKLSPESLRIKKLAREEYAKLGIDTEAAMEKLANKALSVRCWQGDDVIGFDQEGGLSGDIQTTGDYPGRARTSEELTSDFEKAMTLRSGKKRIVSLKLCKRRK